MAARADDVDNSSNSHPKELKEVMKTLGRDGHVMLQAIPGDALDSFLSALCQQHSEQGYNVFPLIGLSQCLEERLPDNKCLLLIHCALGNAKLDPAQYKTFFEINLCGISSPVHHHIVFLVYPHVLLEFQYLNNAARPCMQNSICHIEFKQDYFISDYFNLFKGMLEDTTHSQMLGALLALTMQGHNCLEQGKEETEAQLDILGFQRFSPTQLQNYSQWLVGSLLAENRSEFVTWDVYSAAGLAVARAFSDRITLKTCDVRFLVQHVHTKHNTAADHAEEGTMTGTVLVLTCPSSVLLLMERMLEAMVTGQLSEICQHPSLHSSEFLQEFEAFCKKNKLHDVINAVDPQHGLPLLYWSVWSLSCEFSVWCLRLVMSQHKGDTASEVLLSTALLAALVTNTTDVDMSQFVKVCENLAPLKEVTSMKEIGLPFPSKQKRYTVKLHPICSGLMNCSLCYLGTVPLHTLQQLLTMKLTDTFINFRVEGCFLYLLLWLLTEKQVDEKYREGNTLLHIAADVGQVQVVQMLVQCGASVLTRNKAGLTPPQLAATRRHQRQGRSRVSDTSWKRFRAACRKGDVNTVKSLLCHDTTVCDRGTGGVTGLHLASQSGRTHVASLLIDLGAEINAVDSLQQTPLHLACRGRQLEIVALLVERGADVVTQDSTGQTALHIACERGEVKMATLLLQHNAVVHTHNKAGHTPFVVACLQGHWNLADLLLSHLSDINGSVCVGGVDTLLHLACRDGRTQLAQFFLQHGASVDVRCEDGLTALHLACLAGHTDIVKLLITHSADLDMRIKKGSRPLVMVNVRRQKGSCHTFLFDTVDVEAQCEGGCAALQEAYKAQDTACLRILLHGMSTVITNTSSGTILGTANGNGQTDTLHELLLYDDIDINIHIPKRLSSLHIAAIKGQTQIAELLVQHGAAVDMCDPGGRTPLHWACIFGHTASVKLLLQHHADIDISTSGGETPLHLACTRGHIAIVKLLLQHQADVNISTSGGWTPLHWTCISGHTAVVKLLLQHQADVNISTSDGRTPLMAACYFGHTDTAIHLLQSGADATMKTKKGSTALDLALQKGHSEVVTLLRQHSSNSHSVSDDQQLSSPLVIE